MSMPEREFYEVVEYWGGLMSFGSACGWAGIVKSVSEMSDVQASMFAEYLRGLAYNRFLQTRYWHAVRLKMKSLSASGKCDMCEEGSGEQVHHRSYEHHGSEHAHLQDLLLVCDRCHRAIHEGERLAVARGKL